MKAELHDGRILEFPDGTSPEVVQATVKKVLAQGQLPAATPEPANERGAVMNTLDGLVRGYRDIVQGGMQLGVHGLNKAGILSDETVQDFEKYRAEGLPELSGLGTKDYEERTKGSGWAKAGEIGGSIVATAPLAAGRIPATMGGKVLQGMGVGAGASVLQPVDPAENFFEEKGKQATTGAAVGGIAAPVLGAVARVVSPKTSQEVKDLMSEGVTPTPGQIAGGAFQRAEEGLTSVGILGDFIKAGQTRAIKDFDRAAINRTLKPIGKSLPKNLDGHDAITFAEDTLSRAYNDLLPKLKVDADNAFVGDLNNIRQMGQTMLPDQAKRFENILQHEVIGKFTSAGKMSGETMKQLESKLGYYIRNAQRSEDLDTRLLADALKETQASLRRLVNRANPIHQGELGKINEGFANFVRVQHAAGMKGAHEGVFSPSQLKSGARAKDSSVRHRQFARGEALMQDFAEAGENVLGKKVPDSGTPYRLGNMLMIPGGIAAPAIPAAATIAGMAYTPIGQKTIASLMTQRPDAAVPISELIRRLSPATAISYPALANQ